MSRNHCSKPNVNYNCGNLYLDVRLGTGPFANYLLTIVNNGPQTAFIISSIPSVISRYQEILLLQIPFLQEEVPNSQYSRLFFEHN